MTKPALLYHAAPLHYLPRILECGMLRCASVLAADGVAPRSGAKRRDRMLGLSDWVHLSTRAQTPLLADKIRRGYPHALLVFDGPSTFTPGVALLPGNTKAWRSRAALEPIADPAHQNRLMEEHLRRGRHPSLEILVQYALGLDTLIRIVLIDERERAMIGDLIDAARDDPDHWADGAPRDDSDHWAGGAPCGWAAALRAPLTVEPDLFPGAAAYAPRTLGSVSDYFGRCRDARRVLPPPSIPFD